jgi:hypothetical protein
VGNLHLRFDEGRAGRANASPTLLLYRLGNTPKARFLLLSQMECVILMLETQISHEGQDGRFTGHSGADGA